jgi:DNA-binding NarL/FixJ family response regulator
MSEQAVSVAVHINDPVVSQAVHYIITTEPCWRLCRTPKSSTIQLAGLDVQRWPPSAGARILVTSTQPVKARKAIDAFTDGMVNGIIATDELEQLSGAVSAVTSGLAPVSLRVRDAAESMPRLSERKFAVMAKLSVGCSYGAIATQLHISESTVKREVQELFAAFEVNSRPTLLSAAAAAGIVFI